MDGELKIGQRAISGGMGAYINADAGFWRHVSEVFREENFQLLKYTKQANGDIKVWGDILRNLQEINPVEYSRVTAQGAGRGVFERLVAEGHGNPILSGKLAESSIQQGWDIDSKIGYIQCKFGSNGQLTNADDIARLLNGHYSPANNIPVHGVAMNTETYNYMLSKYPGHFIETSPGSGVAIAHDGTTLYDAGIRSEDVMRIQKAAQEYAMDQGKALNLGEHILSNSLKAAAIAGAVSFIISGSVNYYKVRKGLIRPDDAVDATVGATVKNGLTGGITSLGVGTTMAVLGIPTLGIGIVIAIPLGILMGTGVGAVVNRQLDKIYNQIMGGKQIAVAREKSELAKNVFDKIDQIFETSLNVAAAIPVKDSHVGDYESIINKTQNLNREIKLL